MIQRIHVWARPQVKRLRARVGHLILTQLFHTTVTAVILTMTLLGAARVGALDNVLASLSAPSADTSFTTINYQGRLADASGAPIDNANPGLGMTFALYDVASGGSPIWTETHANVPISQGLFSVRLGSINALDTDLLSGDRWLGIQVGTDPEMAPREKLAAVPYAMQAGFAMEAETVPDSSITNVKLDLSGTLDLGGDGTSSAKLIGDYVNLFLQNIGGNLREISASSIIYFIDSDNDTSDAVFRINKDSDHMAGSYSTVWLVDESGRVETFGTLDMNGNSIINQGAMVEANLQTTDELAADSITRFSEGDLLCWGVTQLELCTQAGDHLVQAVADENGKPIVLGAELVKVLGPVQRGGFLVASDTAGFAIIDNDPQPGTVIAQALEDFDGETGLIRAMIRKF